LKDIVIKTSNKEIVKTQVTTFFKHAQLRVNNTCSCKKAFN